MKVKGLIERISKTSATIKVAPEWNYDDYWKEWRPRGNSVTMTLHIEPTLIDKLIVFYADLSEFQIKEGKIIHIKKIKPPTPSKSNLDILMIGKPKSLRDKLNTIIGTLMQLERKQSPVPTSELIAELFNKGIRPEEASKLIKQLLTEGTIYEPAHGYLKKT
jgi:hypothetical protein